jgi:hypothetical protein
LVVRHVLPMGCCAADLYKLSEDLCNLVIHGRLDLGRVLWDKSVIIPHRDWRW